MVHRSQHGLLYGVLNGRWVPRLLPRLVIVSCSGSSMGTNQKWPMATWIMTRSSFAGVGWRKLSSSNSFLNYIACVVALELTIYLASVEDKATVSCFFEDHATAPPPRRNTYPETDWRLIIDDAQSASE